MKQGTKFILPVTFDYDLSQAEKVEFIFKQGCNSLTFVYPSENAVKVDGKDEIDLIWTPEMTYRFVSEREIRMDTRITVIGSDTNPETEIQSFKLCETLFPKECCK